MKKIAVHTLGCKVNQYDTEAMLESFERAGWQSVPFESGEADLYLVNTCTVTGTGDQKSVRLIRHLGREYPNASIIVAGCLAQRDAARVTLPGVRLVIGTQRRGEVVTLYEAACAQDQPLVAVEPLTKGVPFECLFVSRHEGKTRAVMKIQEGCDRWCSYCIIPSVRGPVRSMSLQAVKAEAERLAAAGYCELVVTGIHLASYGRESGESLTDAIRACHDAPGVKRVRLGSLEPVVVTDAFCAAIREMPRLCPQFHLALQSGCDSVLSRMKRRYTTAEFREAARKLRKALPGCALTTDVLTGFPGETEAEAAETLSFVEEMGFARIHVFPYSRRAGTLADRMGDQVPQSVKRERTAKLIELGNKLEAAYAKEMIGTVREVLFEEKNEGYTPEYVRVRVREAGEPGSIRRVLIEEAEDELATGRVLPIERSE